MQIEILNLRQALTFLKTIVPQASHIPTLSFVLFTQDGNKVTIRGADLGKAGYIEVECSGKQVEPFLVNLDKLHTYVNLAYSDTESLTFSLSGKNRVKIARDDGKYLSFPLIPVEEFPEMMQSDVVGTFSIEPYRLVHGLEMSSFADSKMDRLVSIHMFDDNGKLKMEAMNGFCGGYIDLGSYDVAVDICIPPTITKPLKMMSRVDDEDLIVSFSDRHIFVSGKSWYVGFSIDVQPYPDISNIYRNSCVNRLMLSREEFIRNLGYVKLIAEDYSNITLTVRGGKVSFSSTLLQGDGENFMTVPEEEADNTITLDLRELNKVISMLGEDFFYLQLGDSEQVLIYENNEKMYFTLPQS